MLVNFGAYIGDDRQRSFLDGASNVGLGAAILCQSAVRARECDEPCDKKFEVLSILSKNKAYRILFKART